MNDFNYQLEHIFSFDAQLENPPEVIGPVAAGIRINFYCKGGEITGPKLQGRVRSEMTGRGYPIITSLNLPIAKVAYFDTTKEIGVVTEIIGATEAGFEFVKQLKNGAA